MAEKKKIRSRGDLQHEKPAQGQERPAKKAKLLDDSDEDSDGSNGEDGGVSLNINEEYAKRFEHNKKRIELQKLEEKYGKKGFKNGAADIQDDESDVDSQEGVSEDDEAEFATEALDAEIAATLNAIRSKDPRVYDKSATFYRSVQDDDESTSRAATKESSMTLKDYHTKNLLEGKFEADDEDEVPQKTYNEEMEEAKQNLLKEAQADSQSDAEDSNEFLVAKSKPDSSKKQRARITEDDVEKAEQDPENFLSNFMASRAWVPTDASQWKPLESDESDEDERAEEYEDAYNMYFEDPATQNEKLVTYARDAVASTTVRREEKSGRRKAREAARAKREAEKQEREGEVARLRKLKIEEMEGKVNKIRKIGGFNGKNFDIEDWADVLEADWSDEQWDAEMRKRFDDAYYDEVEANGDSDDNGSKKKRKPKKPKFDDDIDIKDLVPDFDDEGDQEPTFSLSDEHDASAGSDMDVDGTEDTPKQSKSSRQHKQERADAKSASRRDRRLIENLVDASLEFEKSLASNSKTPSRFQYRETSPTSFGLTPRDILLATDAQLNEFAGLKKLASFRDPAKKKKDRKHLSKKARLRQWRMDTFGDSEEPTGGFEVLLGNEETAESSSKPNRTEVDIREGDGSGKRKKRRSKKRKASSLDI
ncbi:Krr1-domain-containing protein [Aaosphaeria arxii CBS 175.79]|uniref:Krr1-domain-containing protein n=1 Tax=Aaosphaeria arxii CBS 175.79 TaxID=1450172 RepID=A0A6A5XUB3_9PLEO|nr:Krr1-domain-containing protein [Aaosphaeria arxii CBS 175.79]KAF2016792.1 Krr1-domain-containing protein [Aaosphaeria arxii CBS 175.79]